MVLRSGLHCGAVHTLSTAPNSGFLPCETKDALELPRGILKSVQIYKNVARIKTKRVWNSLAVQWVKDPAVSLPPLGSLLWHRFALWPGNFPMLWEWPKKKKVVGFKHLH